MKRGWQIMHTNHLQNHFRTCVHWIILALGWCPVPVSTAVLVSVYKPANMKRAVEISLSNVAPQTHQRQMQRCIITRKGFSVQSTNVCCPFKVSIPNWGYLWPELYCNIWVHQMYAHKSYTYFLLQSLSENISMTYIQVSLHLFTKKANNTWSMPFFSPPNSMYITPLFTWSCYDP
jgi:hypothetical protein